MDILRKELNAIYHAQHLDLEPLDPSNIAGCKADVAICSQTDGDCRVITDASSDRCWIFPGRFGQLLGLSPAMAERNSSDEDEIYTRMHPEDLADKRMLEYEFFKFVDTLPPDQKLAYKATCRIRIKDSHGRYIIAANSTQLLRLSPAGKIWLILCCYDLADSTQDLAGIAPRILDSSTGRVIRPDLSEKRRHLLTDREKEILALIRDGHPSKIIAHRLGISIHTVNRHRQNILSKLSVGNSIEAITAATAMKLM